MKKQFTVHVVPSTHWDREWYISQKRYQFRLVRLMQKVEHLLENEQYPNFLLDGQTIPVEDYLEIHPEKETLMKELISKNKLTIGPWYVVPDTLIPSGESLMKNLLIGYQHLQKYGGKNSVGYCPDSFGIASQLPQLFSQFGYQSMQYCRGQRVDDLRYHGEAVFCSPDGSNLLSLYDGYCSGLMLSVTSVWRNMFLQTVDVQAVANSIKTMFECHKEHSEFIGENRLLIAGIDHAEPKEELTEVIAKLNEFLPEMQFVHSSQDVFFEALQKEFENKNVPRVFGEQRGKYDEHFTLSNTLSAGMDVKLLNRKVENMLERFASPIQIFTKDLSSELDFGTDKLLEFAWKTLIQNHAHDSICACSADEVMEDIKKRLRDAYDLTNDILNLKLQKLAQNIKPNELSPVCILVYNPLPYETDAAIDSLVKIPYDLDGENFIVCEADGTVIEGSEAILSVKKRLDIETEKVSDEVLIKDTTRVAVPESTARDIYSFVNVRFQAVNLPACGYRCFYLQKSEKAEVKPKNITFGSNFCENSLIKIAFHENGSFDLLDKRSGTLYKNQNLFEETEDIGDTYTYSPGRTAFSFQDLQAEITINDKAENFIEYLTEITYSLPIPLQDTKPMKLRSTIRMWNDSDRIDIKTTIHNSTFNHRLRASFTIPENISLSYSDTAFDIVKRPIIEENERTEKSILTMPMRNLVYLSGNNASFALFSASSHEYECIRNKSKKETTLFITLPRSVEAVYKTVTLTKNEAGSGVGTRWWTKSGKMLGEFTASYAIKPYHIPIKKADIFKHSEQYQYQPVIKADYAEGTLNSINSYCSVTGCSLSGIVQAQSGIIIRVVNFSDETESCKIKLNLPFSKAFTADPTGNIIAPLSVSDNQILFDLGHNRILNILIK